MKNFILITIAFSFFSCKENNLINEHQLIGNWFFIDEEQGGDASYNEVYIDSTKMVFNLSFGLLSPREHLIKRDTLFITNVDTHNVPFWIIKKIKHDTISVDFLDNNSRRALELIRLDKNDKTRLDYKDSLWRNNDNLWQEFNEEVYKRYERYQVRSGFFTWDELEEFKKDSSNLITLPDVEN